MRRQIRHIHGYPRQSVRNVRQIISKEQTSTHLLQVNIVSKLHVFGVNTKYFETTSRIRDTNVNFTIEATEATQCRIDRIWSIGSGHNYDVRASLQAVHQGQQL